MLLISQNLECCWKCFQVAESVHLVRFSTWRSLLNIGKVGAMVFLRVELGLHCSGWFYRVMLLVAVMRILLT